ncbi:retinol dehydrogenase 14-like isoform X2 [Anneissia japonica]|uniref:retinol dehydrogenase 14-like isoform X2 n=1 Tax=Anneissia japonica TaxID=1529436 RepID=UPI0014257A8A|nr:retinol dehydrogenase 14-like isoform X2 [Anneissia japonica]
MGAFHIPRSIPSFNPDPSILDPPLKTVEQIKSEHEYERTYNTPTASDLKLVPMELDLASFASAMAFINEFKRQQLKLDIMILNAGIAGVKKTMTCDGIESHFQVNYLTHFLICLHLIPIIDESKGIVITIASEAHRVLAKFKVNNFQGEKKYGRFEMYGNSKLFQVMSAFAFERRLPGSNIKFVCLHPGHVTDTSLGQHISDMSVLYLMRQCFYAVSGCHASDVAENIVEILKQREFEYHSDVYYECRTLVEASPDARDAGKQDQLWAYSLNLLKLYLPTLPPHFQHW